MKKICSQFIAGIAPTENTKNQQSAVSTCLGPALLGTSGLSVHAWSCGSCNKTGVSVQLMVEDILAQDL